MAEHGSSIDLHEAGPMRALAHPLRLRILGLLRVEGPKSVGMVVEATGAASGSVSYHLATLAKHGFVVPAPELGHADALQARWPGLYENGAGIAIPVRTFEGAYFGSWRLYRVR